HGHAEGVVSSGAEPAVVSDVGDREGRNPALGGRRRYRRRLCVGRRLGPDTLADDRRLTFLRSLPPMKTPILAAMLCASLFALPVAAQTTPPAPTGGTAAATLPNAFGEPAAPAVAEAPDIARSEQALRAAIASFQSGNVDYSVFSD